ncbi:glycoside hydrolase superfamily [Xylariales sp. PMI_506]|nr:glycoside hydrolase superfamily [Xylariales sp. PMI_506]
MLAPETGIDGWLRYGALSDDFRAVHKQYSAIVVLSTVQTSPVYVAGQELQDGISKILGQELKVESTIVAGVTSSIIVGTVATFASSGAIAKSVPQLKEDGYWIDSTGDNILILGHNERGTLYGAFDFLSTLAQGNSRPAAYASNPSAPIRYTNQWDNLDGTIERGYGGKSIFFKDELVIEDLTRVRQYARLLASVHLNGCIVNNVNSSHNLLNTDNLKGLGRIADVMRPYGVRIGISLFFDTPRALGGLPTSDPLDPAVIAWWNDITTKIYQHVPDMLGFTIKANSEGQPGPLTYGRTLADGANMFARALKPHGDGIVMYRAFVYNHHLEESNPKNDRANAAVEYFADLDDEFDDNVLIQIKFGPIDFQIREPPSPLLARLRKTAIMIEFMVAQEYLGQQSHYVYMAPEWKTILDFDFRIDDKSSPVRDIVSGEHFGWPRAGYAAVVNTGNDSTWIGNHLSLSNLYAYGRLCWNPADDSKTILQDWVRLTFGLNETVLRVITEIGMETWPTYENYSGNLGIQTLCDILYTHFGPGPASQDGNGWGQWTRADAQAIGMDRTVATGTGNAGQYPSQVASVFENIETTPDELLLWFHHVPYTYRLKSGKTVIQHFYDAHYDGSTNAQTFPQRWETLRGLIDDSRFNHVSFRLRYQAGHSLVWRDSINEFYRAKCGIQDEKGRVGNHPWRIEAEDMELSGYKIVPVTPFEAASGGKAIITSTSDTPGTAATTLQFPSGMYDVAINYYDHKGGRSKYEIFLNEKAIGTWTGDLEDHLGHDFSEFVDGHSATRTYFRGIKVEKGDILKIVGYPDGTEFAPIDYVSILPNGIVD